MNNLICYPKMIVPVKTIDESHKILLTGTNPCLFFLSSLLLSDTHCLLYSQSFRPSVNGTGVRGFKYPPEPWQPPTTITTLGGMCSLIYTASLAPGHRGWEFLVSHTSQQSLPLYIMHDIMTHIMLC